MILKTTFDPFQSGLDCYYEDWEDSKIEAVTCLFDEYEIELFFSGKKTAEEQDSI